MKAEGKVITWDALKETGNSRREHNKGMRSRAHHVASDSAVTLCDVPKPPTVMKLGCLRVCMLRRSPALYA